MRFVYRIFYKSMNIIWLLHAGAYTMLLKLFKKLPAPQPNEASAVSKVIHLTFDDGPGPHTRRLLSILGRYNIKATFFVTGNGDSEIIRDIAKAGHAIGNHTKSHKYKIIYASEEAFFKDLSKMQDVIYEKTGKNTGLMRFPGGSSNTVSRFNPGIMTRLSTSVQENGYHYFDWNVDSDDAGQARTSYRIFRNVISNVSQTDCALVLMHDVKKKSVAAVQRIIIWGLKNGYTFLPLTENSMTCHHKLNN